MKQIYSICLASVVTAFPAEMIKAITDTVPLTAVTSSAYFNRIHFGIDASLRYFEDTLHESTLLLKKTHRLLELIETSHAVNMYDPAHAICKLCGNYEKLLVHIDSIIEGRIHVVLPSANWATAITDDLGHMYRFTRNLIEHLQASADFYAIAETSEDCPAWIETHSKARKNLRLLEISIEVLRFHIERTRETMNELET